MPKNKKNPEADAYPLEKPYKKIAISFLVLATLLALVIVYFTLSKATITLEPKEAPEAKEFTFSVPLNNTSTDLAISGTLTEKELEITQSFDVKNFKTEPGKSTGTITIINNNDKSQSLIATTRFLSPNNLIFRLKNNVTVPAGKSADATFEADQTGDKYDIAPTTFTIPGLSQNLQAKIYGQSKTAFTGGVKKTGQLTAEEIATDQQQMLNNLDQSIKNQLGLVANDQTAIFINKDIASESVSNKAGDSVEKLTVTVKVNAKVISVDTEKLLARTKEEYKKQMTDKTSVVSYNLSSFQYSLISADETQAQIKTSLSAYNLHELDVKSIEKDKLFGLDETGVKYFFSQYDNIKSVEVKFWPFWVKAVPSMADHVVIEVKN